MSRPELLRRRTRREWLAVGLVLAGLVGFVGLTYLVVVVLGGLLLGHSDTPHVGLSVLATAIVAVGFDRVLTRLEGFAARAVHRGRPSPYDAMRRFAGAVDGAGPTEDLPLRMARLLAEGTGAEWVRVWVAIDGQRVTAATWPPGARRAAALGWETGTRRLPVRHGDEELGMLVLREREGTSLTPVEERLFADLAAQAGLVLRGVRLRASLERRLAELSTREEDLRRSRERLVDAQDEARRRLERDIHDGAQQHLVALAVNLRLAANLAASAPERAEALLAAQIGAAEDALATLHRLSSGIYPPRLEEEGIAAALREALRDGVAVVTHGATRFPIAVEAAAYFCALEAVQNATKHAGDATVRVEVDARPEELVVTVTDDGVGFDPARAVDGTGLANMGLANMGLANMRDRVDSAGGELELTSTLGQGTRVRVVLPAQTLASADGRG